MQGNSTAMNWHCPIQSPFNQIIICKLDLKFPLNWKYNKAHWLSVFKGMSKSNASLTLYSLVDIILAPQKI